MANVVSSQPRSATNLRQRGRTAFTSMKTTATIGVVSSPRPVQRSWQKSVLDLCCVALIVGGCVLGGADAHILVYRRLTSQELTYTFSQLIEEYNDLPALFGSALPSNGLRVFAISATTPDDLGCHGIQPPPTYLDYPNNAKFVALIKRGGENCTFELKARGAQAAHYDAAIVYNNNGDDLEQMSAKNGTGITIPIVFVGHTTGMNLRSFQTSEIVLVINDELPFNINTQLILPFSILMGLCFLIMIFYMIYKCVREQRRLRRHRLPKHLLKKLPILKYTKNSDLSYDTCVICLDDFAEGDKLRVLPCRHPYHSHCIDPWLTENRRVCPVCKRKVFTKGEARSNRNRQSSLDSVTDTDDDTTPLLQQPSSLDRGRAARGAIAGAPTAATTATTRHGTFLRASNNDPPSNTDATSDDENVLLARSSPAHSSERGRVNPFDRTPNLPRHLAAQLNDNRRSIWSYPIFRFFERRPRTISVAAPPYLEEVVQNDAVSVARPSPSAGQRPAMTAASMPRALPPPPPMHSSNNILNPNLSGSFKDDDDELPHHSIYEPIAVVTPVATTAVEQQTGSNANNAAAMQDVDSLFLQTPSQGGIGVAALPNTQNAPLQLLLSSSVSSSPNASDRRKWN